MGEAGGTQLPDEEEQPDCGVATADQKVEELSLYYGRDQEHLWKVSILCAHPCFYVWR